VDICIYLHQKNCIFSENTSICVSRSHLLPLWPLLPVLLLYCLCCLCVVPVLPRRCLCATVSATLFHCTCWSALYVAAGPAVVIVHAFGFWAFLSLCLVSCFDIAVLLCLMSSWFLCLCLGFVRSDSCVFLFGERVSARQCTCVQSTCVYCSHTKKLKLLIWKSVID
jgi:hypothetical protein